MGVCQSHSKHKPKKHVISTAELPPQLTKKWSFFKGNIREFYIFGEVLATSSYGTLRKAIKKNTTVTQEGQRQSLIQETFIIKTVMKKIVSPIMDHIQEQLLNLSKLDHPNIAKIYEAYEDEGFLYIVMESCDQGELFAQLALRSPNENYIAVVMRKLFQAVAYMHSKDLPHLNIKPESILVTKCGEIKLCNFGFGNRFGLESPTNQEHFYHSPEYLGGELLPACDNWALGIFMFVILSGYHPFKKKHPQGQIYVITQLPPEFKPKIWEKLSKESIQLVRGLLNKDPHHRTTAEQALKSDWINLYSDESQLQILNLKVPMVAYVPDYTPFNNKNYKLLKMYANSNKFKKETLRIFVNHLDEKDISKLQAKFYELDADHNGYITVSELQEALDRIGNKASQQELEQLLKKIPINQFDKNQGFKIEYSDFIAATIDKQLYLKKENMWSMFKLYDVHNRNYIEEKDLAQAFKVQGRTMPPLKIHHLFNEMDQNGDGKADFADFCRVMLNLRENEFAEIYEKYYASPTKPLLTDMQF